MGIFLLVVAPLAVWGQNTAADSAWLTTHYFKKEVYITMRDGKRLFTAIYSPMDGSSKHPILLNRSPYSVAPYSPNQYKAFWNGPYMAYLREGYIIALQDVRGKFMSEGEFVDVRPYIPNKKVGSPLAIDESSDTYDTIDWLVKNTKNNNGKVGVWGISYPGFYATEAALCGHPALKAVSPQAPVTDWFMGDDFHHNGAFMEMDAFSFYSGFGKKRRVLTDKPAAGFQYYTSDNYKFYLEQGPLKSLAILMGDTMQFWNDMYYHPNYDQWWKARNARSTVQNIPKKVATLEVGGLYDAEDCYGAWNLYRAIEEKAGNNNKLVMGPWSHGGWARGTGEYLGNVRFGSETAKWYQQNVEQPFFDYYLLGKGNAKKIAEATIFFSGSNKWKQFSKWPPKDVAETKMMLQPEGKISAYPPTAHNKYVEYTSDPAKPVPYTADVQFARGADYMTDDQRFAARRPDVIVFQTDSLKDDVTVAGPVIADLFAAISTTDADFVVKLIDVFPDKFAYNDTVDGKGNGKAYQMSAYQMLVRGEVMRGRYRNSFEKPEAFVPVKITEVKYQLPDVAHTFKKGHRIMVQIQSSWFPLVDRNPQQFVNIYNCNKIDFVPSDIKIYCDAEHASNIILPIIPSP